MLLLSTLLKFLKFWGFGAFVDGKLDKFTLAYFGSISPNNFMIEKNAVSVNLYESFGWLVGGG